jgi:hypothetical protein
MSASFEDLVDSLDFACEVTDELEVSVRFRHRTNESYESIIYFENMNSRNSLYSVV